MFSLLAITSYLITSAIPITQAAVKAIEYEALSGIPVGNTFAIILFGIGAEVSQPIQSANTDLVNWLPISPTDYVAGSVLSLSYTYSFIPAFLLGSTLGLAVQFGYTWFWLETAVMSGISSLIGASAIELLRALTNRISSSFYKKSGQSGIFLRLMVTVATLVFFEVLFSGRMILFLLQSTTRVVETGWFLPFVWPSLVIIAAYERNVFGSVVYAFISVVFATSLYVLATISRARYWTPVPVSIRFTRKPLMRTSIKFPWSDSAEAAILRKDLRSLIRRREMARFLAIPILLIVSMGASLIPLSGGSFPERAQLFATIPLYLIPTAAICGLFSMTSIGQEGPAVLNLYIAPIQARQLLRPKLALTVALGLIFGAALLSVMSIFLRIVAHNNMVLFSLGVVTVLEESALGLYFGAKFPDFRETIRSRYVSVWGSIVGTILGTFILLLTASPVLLSVLLLGSAEYQFMILAGIFGVVVFMLAWKLAERQMERLLQSIRV
jgi:hypothetical protein